METVCDGDDEETGIMDSVVNGTKTGANYVGDGITTGFSTGFHGAKSALGMEDEHDEDDEAEGETCECEEDDEDCDCPEGDDECECDCDPDTDEECDCEE